MGNTLRKWASRSESLHPETPSGSDPVNALRRFLLLVLLLRLLLPPGICLCHDNSPATRLVLSLLDPSRPLPPAAPVEDDDHDPGCPGSVLATGMGLKLPLVALLPLQNALLTLPGLNLPVPWSFPNADPPDDPPSPLPPFLEDGTLLI